jgi:hypothetical protein
MGAHKVARRWIYIGTSDDITHRVPLRPAESGTQSKKNRSPARKDGGMSFTLAGFDEREGLRRFAFEHIAGNNRTTVVVKADLSLTRKHDIRLQDLPLICARLLQNLGTETPAGSITLTEEHMIAIQAAARAASEKRRKVPRRPHREAGRVWPSPRP